MSTPQLFIIFRSRLPWDDIPTAVVRAPSAERAVQVFEVRFAGLTSIEVDSFVALPALECTAEQRAQALEALGVLFELNVSARAVDTLEYLAQHPGGNAVLADICRTWPQQVRELQAEELRFYREVLFSSPRREDAGANLKVR